MEINDVICDFGFEIYLSRLDLLQWISEELEIFRVRKKENRKRLIIQAKKLSVAQRYYDD